MKLSNQVSKLAAKILNNGRSPIPARVELARRLVIVAGELKDLGY